MDWFCWTWDIEAKLTAEVTENLNSDETIHELLEVIESAINMSTTENCPKKSVSKHSKPYWTPELTTLSEKLRSDIRERPY